MGKFFVLSCNRYNYSKHFIIRKYFRTFIPIFGENNFFRTLRPIITRYPEQNCFSSFDNVYQLLYGPRIS